MTFRSSSIFKAAAFLFALSIFISSMPQDCLAEGWDFFSCVESGSKEDDAAAQRAVKIDQLMEKAREMRFQGRFRQARAYAEGALKVEKDNKLAQAFLANLDVEEARHKAGLEQIKKAREEAKRSAAEAAKTARDEAARKKQEAKEAQIAEQEAKKKSAAELREQAVQQKAVAPEKVAPQPALQEKEPAPAAVPVEAEPVQAPAPSPQAMPSTEATTAPIASGEAAAAAAEPSGEMTTLPAWRSEEMAKESKESQESAALPEQKETEAPSPGMEQIPGALSGKETVKLQPGQPIVVNGDKVEYFEEGKIRAEGNVIITYGDIKLSCDKIEVDTKAKQALCEGHVKIEQPDGVLTGERIVYDLNNRRGEVISGEVKAYPWYGKADETARVSENEYLLRRGFVTTCDQDEPHYRLAAKEIKFYPDEKIIAKNVVMYVGKVPVMWIPYYYQPIIEYRAKVQLIPGNNTDWGYFLLSGWRFHIKGKSKVDVLLDYRTKKGFAQGENFYYHAEDFGLEGLGSGVFRSYFIEQNDWGTYEPKGFRDEGIKPELRKRFQWMHRVDFDPGTVGLIEFNKMSDPNVLKDYFYNEFEEYNRSLPSYVSLISARENYIFSFQADRLFNNFDSGVQRQPEVKIDIPDQRLWDTPMYYSSQTSGTSFEKKYAFYSLPPERVQRFDTLHRLTYVTGVGPVNLQPYGEFRETVYSRNQWESGIIQRETVGAGVNAFSQLHRIYDVNTDFAGLDINGLRHVVVPGVLYFFQEQPNVDKDNLYQMDEIDTLEKENGVRLSIQNKFQTKRRSVLDPTQLRRVDLVRFIAYTDYLFRMEKKGFEFKKPGKFDNVNFDLELDPYDWLFIQGKMSTTPKNAALNTGSLEFSLRPGRRFKMDLGYRYEKRPDEPRNQLTFDTSYILNPKWRLGLYERWNMQESRIEEQQFSITRDLHCWEVELVYDVEGANLFSDEFTIWFAFKIKAFPDLQIGLDRSYTKTAPGSMREDDTMRPAPIPQARP